MAENKHVDSEEELETSVDIGDIWKLAKEKPTKAPTYQTWDIFENPSFDEPHIPYITEAGPQVFDAALASKSDILGINNVEHVVLRTDVFASSLVSLGLGRSSVLYDWDDDKNSFVQKLDKFRISGCTGSSLASVQSTFLECGNSTKALKTFVDTVYERKRSPGQIALADAVSTVLGSLQARLNVPVSSVGSILQIQAMFRPAEQILICFRQLIKSISSSQTDEAMLSLLFDEIQRLEHSTGWLRNILQEVLSRVSATWLEFAAGWLGTQRESGLPITKDGPGKSFVRVEDKSWVDELGIELFQPDYILDRERIPSFMSDEDAKSLFETGRSLRFLRSHHESHPLANSDVIASANPPSLDWQFSWQGIEQIEAKALRYEKDLAAAVKKYSNTNTIISDSSENVAEQLEELNLFGKPAEEMQNHFLASIDLLNQPLNAGSRESPDQLSSILQQVLAKADGPASVDNDVSLAPPVSLVPALSFCPIIATQARIINGTCMRLFFKSHNLREHLSVQRGFHLLGNGVFSSRLAHALFDPDLETAERQPGVARTGSTMGLRLGGRENWPPASSELRLALMGILTESYNATIAGTAEKALPGDLSFAVRDMTEKEIAKCMDPNSIEALDFLRLSYKPPSPLEAVITPISLYKYDQLFKLLLRVSRMLFVVDQLFRDGTDRTSHWQKIDTSSQKFRIEAHHFITSLSAYFFDTGIAATWRTFENKLDQIEARINTDEHNVTLGQHEGLDKLREYHEHVLDRILFALLLRKRQKPIMNLLEEIFGLILKFSKYSRSRAAGSYDEDGGENHVNAIHAAFRKKVAVFITVCRGLSERKSYGEKTGIGKGERGSGGLFGDGGLVEENTVGQLVLRLEMSDYYSRTG